MDRHTVKRILMDSLIRTALFFTVAHIILAGVNSLHPVRVVGTSMEPTLKDEQLLWTSADISAENIGYGDIVVFRDPRDTDKLCVKRVVGLPGDEIMIYDGMLARNSVRVEDGFPLIREAGMSLPPLKLKDNEYFCLGDNRNNSCDSRDMGPIPIGLITNIVKQ